MVTAVTTLIALLMTLSPQPPVTPAPIAPALSPASPCPAASPADGPMASSSPSTTRAPSSQIRRASGGKDLSQLKKLLATGWTKKDLNNMASEDGKGAIHMAAWQGSIEILDYLIKTWNCDVNGIATGTYSYGKTPIFFATTRSRDDVVLYLLEQTDASVKIVNNKGQSVLSIASSHLKPTTIEAIQKAEQRQRNSEFINYRLTHSDNLEYGDLDPRFLDRPLRPGDDVVTPLAVNPTTRESRRGNFARKNPQVAKEVVRRKNKKANLKREKNGPPLVTQEELETFEIAWNKLSAVLKDENILVDSSLLAAAMLEIVQCGDTMKGPWIPKAANRLERLCTSDQSKLIQDFVISGRENERYTDREQVLLEKWTRVTWQAKGLATSGSKPSCQAPKLKSGNTRDPILLTASPWSSACRAVEKLSRAMLQKPNSLQLTLPEPPTWICDEHGLDEMEAHLRRYVDHSSPSAVALDTEWTTFEDGKTVVSTIQISIAPRPEACPKLKSWVVDLQPSAPSRTSYQNSVATLLQWLFHDCETHLLGFAFAHDLSKIQSFLSSSSLETADIIDASRVLDVQRLAAQMMDRHHTMLPGLKSCASHFLSRPVDNDCGQEYFLSKKEQCSDWGKRPLSEGQLNYAGLDAVVLLVLLAEMVASQNPTTTENKSRECS